MNQITTQKSQPSPQKKPLILAVDDDRIMRMALVNMLEELGYEVLEAVNGQVALDIILRQYESLDAVLLDREMPVMDGMQLVKKMKENRDLRNIPIIMQTGSNRPEQIKQGIDAGAFYYLTKPVDQDVLKSVLSAAVRETEQHRLLSTELRKHKTSFNLMENCKFKIKTLSEAEQLASFLVNCFPDPGRAISGLAELLINAVEHGNLGITYDEKTTLIDTGTWRDEINRRAELPENKDKSVEVHFARKLKGSFVSIKDEGKGFDWKNFLQVDPARSSDNHGRGIAQANMVSFDKLTYNEIGNEVVAYIGNDQTLEW